MENSVPYFKYIAIAVGSIIGIIVLIWSVVAFSFFRRSRGVTNYITDFFNHIIEDDLNQVYAMATSDFQKSHPLPKLRKFIKSNQLKRYKRTRLALPQIDGNRYTTNLTIILDTGREISLKISLLKEDKSWKIDQLQRG